MKKSLILTLGAALTLSACADLGFGVDVDSGTASPYWYGNGYLGSGYWNTPTWGLGPVYNPIPPSPPVINVLPGPARPPHRPQPPQANPTPQPPHTSFPGINGAGIDRPGNNGFPTPGQGSQAPAAPQQSPSMSANARR